MGAALPVIGLAGSIIGTGMSVIGGLNAASAKADAAHYGAQVAERNAKVSEQNAKYAEAAGRAQEEREGLKTRNLIGQAVAAQASSGLDVNAGSAADVRGSIAALGRLSGLTIRNSAARQAAGYRIQGQDYTESAALAEKSAADAEAAGLMGAAGTLVGGITGAANMAIKDYQAGIFPGLSTR